MFPCFLSFLLLLLHILLSPLCVDLNFNSVFWQHVSTPDDLRV